MMKRTDIINHLIRKCCGTSYLEIGIREPDGNFDHIVCSYKIGVDPAPHRRDILPITSDQFFAQNKDTFDVIFIDGLHVADQVERDIVNSLNVLRPNGYVICHDMSPTDEIMQMVPNQRVGAPWTGDCWKAWVKLRATRPDLQMYVVDTDSGVGVISIGQQETIEVNLNDLSYQNLEINRANWLNLITTQQFYEL